MKTEAETVTIFQLKLFLNSAFIHVNMNMGDT